ncbi:prepilin peptidase [Thalassotalea agarivorans]|uniref:Prepilin leader peptidase/N-methyltransferase n=1 Tax=Thalassotalea agarivorans TaxID=349064 RepID=A0A1H9Y3G8_THASX|nr:A24 family peptidase [Thalassotalea agarivorans]SES63289.1 type 4 prepilin peptidase 1 Aspartic peptidase. MEROPS family A24A [Thalassotalea agarivorans]
MFQQLIESFQQNPTFFLSFVGLASLAIGSFLNVVIYRFPKMLERGWYQECREFLGDEVKDIPEKTFEQLSLSKPDSTCPKCGHAIRWYENIPVLSWIVLRGKCSNCKNGISFRYPSIELATAVLSVIVAHYFGVSLLTVAVLLLTWGLIVLTMIDLDHMILPDQFVYPLLWLGLLINIDGTFVPLETAVIGAVVGYLSLWVVFQLFKLLTGREGMGHGDFKLIAVFGAWFGWQLLPLLILMSSAVGAVVGVIMMFAQNKGRQTAIPFGPYIATAGWICLLWGNQIWDWYLSKI